MKRSLCLIVNYLNPLQIWHVEAEKMILSSKSDCFRIEDFAEIIAEIYIGKGCSEVVCIEFLRGDLSAKVMKDLAQLDIKFISDQIKKDLGRRWIFRKGDSPDSPIIKVKEPAKPAEKERTDTK